MLPMIQTLAEDQAAATARRRSTRPGRMSGVRSRGTANMGADRKRGKTNADLDEPNTDTAAKRQKQPRKRVFQSQGSPDESDDDRPLSDRGKGAGAAGHSSKHGGNAAGGGTTVGSKDATPKDSAAPAEVSEQQRAPAYAAAKVSEQLHDTASDSDGGLGEIASSVYTEMPWASVQTEACDEQEDAEDMSAVVHKTQSPERMKRRMADMNNEHDASQFAQRFVFNRTVGDKMRTSDFDSETPQQAHEREQSAMNSHAFWCDKQVMGGHPLKFGMWPNIMHTAITWLGPHWLHDNPKTRYADILPSGAQVMRPKISKMFIQAAVDTHLCGEEVPFMHPLALNLANV
jgi:hypothetical protein